MTNVLRRATGPIGRTITQFLRGEDGIMAPHILVFFFLMLVTGGIAVDVMRFETKRVAVQNTLDRAALAAASLEQKLDPTAVVNDYFTKAGLGSNIDGVDVKQGANFRIITADAKVLSRNYFMSLLDTPELQGTAASTAEQRITNVEIALVLDVSGSMYNSISRITNLKVAAKDFVDTVLANDVENKISIALVPYNGQVNLGETLFSKYTTTYKHGFANSYCIDLPTDSFTSLGLSRATPLPQTPFIDTWSTTTQNGWLAMQGPTVDARGLYSNVWCNPVAGNIVRMPTNNRATLKANIDGLVAIGATSIELGMKWGAIVLDPGTQPITSSMVGSGGVPSYFANRPAAYSDRETMKVIVLMTDGENFEQERISDSYRTGDTSIYKSLSAGGEYSIFHASKVDRSTTTKLCNSRPYWVPHLGAWHSRPWIGTNPSSSACYSGKTETDEAASYVATVKRMKWQELWKVARTSWVVYQFYARPGIANYTTKMNEIRTQTATSTMDSRLKTICATAKANRVAIYGIAFEAPAGGKAAIQSCVSEPISTYYFDVSGLEIKTAFALIASNLSQLRLTQ